MARAHAHAHAFTLRLSLTDLVVPCALWAYLTATTAALRSTSAAACMPARAASASVGTAVMPMVAVILSIVMAGMLFG